MAVPGSIGIAVYRSDLGANAPAHLNGAELGAAHSTLGGALSVAASLPDRLGTELVTAARTAFAHGLDAASLGAAVVMLVAGVLCARYFRGVQVTADATASQRPQSELVS